MRRIFSIVVLAGAVVLVASCGDDPPIGEAFDGGLPADAGSSMPDAPDGSDAEDANDRGDASDASGGELFDFGSDPADSCNGAAHLCDRTIDEVTYLTTHNAYSTRAEDFIAPNQTHSMKRQLADGVRGLMLDIWDTGDFETSLCHSSCIFGERALVDGLRDIAAFLEARPKNVVTLILESYVSGAAFEAALVEAGLGDRVWIPAGEELPTLRELIEARRQVILLTNRDAGAFPGYLDVWSWAWDTDWNNSAREDFDCARLRGSTENPLFILNHFLTNPVANTALAQEANSDPFMRERVAQCAAEAGQMPNYVTVDFYEIGAAMEIVERLNAP